MKLRVLTLGCKVNWCDSAAIAAEFADRGWEVVEEGREAEALVVNTCAVTHVAEAKARKLVRRLIREQPGRAVLVVGCAARVSRSAFEGIPGVSAVVPGHDPAEVVETVQLALGQETHSPTPTTATQPEGPRHWASRTRAFLKVQDGCDHGCSYCIVPRARPRVWSRTIAAGVSEMEALAASGVKEVVLTGIRLGAFGRERGKSPRAEPRASLAALLRALRPVRIGRLRLSSIEPMDVTEELVSELADHLRLCHHLHLPLQSGDDEVLRAMGRGYSAGDYLRVVEQVRKAWPGVSFTTDVMVGFPGEDEASFARTCELVRQVGFGRLHVFEFSPRPGTAAAGLPWQVPERAKAERSRALARLGNELAARRAAEQVGGEAEVLFEKQEDGFWTGYTRGYFRARCPSEEELGGEVRRVRVVGAEGSTVEVELP
jgi:threonylcarbamoyladenosine tRNA methylthiotransferase MtaB